MSATLSARRTAHVGLIVPSINSCSEPELARLAPTGVAFHATRVRLRSGEIDDLREMAAASAAAAALLDDLSPDVIGFHCTAASMALGTEAARELAGQIEAAVSCPVVTTGQAAVGALEALEARTIQLLTPYQDDVTAAEAVFLSDHGFIVLDPVALRLGPDRFASVTPEQWFEQAVRIADPRADVMFVSCTNIRVLEAVKEIERELQRPVLTSNQAMLWGVLRALDLPTRAAGGGILLGDSPA